MKIEFFDARCYVPNHGDTVLVKHAEGYSVAVYTHPLRRYHACDQVLENVLRWARLPA